ncbi:peptidoglycan-binding domain-containing protein [Streptomyces sp. NPDC003011]
MRLRTFAAAAAAAATLVTGPALAAPALAGTSGAAGVHGCNYTDSTPTISMARNSSGTAVKQAQCLLEYWGYDVGSSGIDGDFGEDTNDATRSFQYDSRYYCTTRLSVDGEIGTNTWRALRGDGCP